MLKDCFATLADDERPVIEHDKIDYLLDGIQNASLASAISNISMSVMLWPSFKEAANILLREVQRIFSLAANKGKRTIAQMDANHDDLHTIGATARGRGGRGQAAGGRGQGRGGRGGNHNAGRGGQVMLQGVDVTDPKQTFSKEEWNKLKGQWNYIWDKRGGRGAGGDPGCGRGQGTGQEGANIQARSIQALQQATTILSEIMGTGQEAVAAEVPANAGNSFGGASYGGRHVQFQQGLPQGRGGPRTISKVKSGARRTVNSASSHRDQDIPESQQVGECEMDSHADTCCLEFLNTFRLEYSIQQWFLE